MSIIETNIKAMKEHKSVFYSLHEEGVKDFDADKNVGINICDARDGSKYMQYEKDDVIIRINSNYNPSREATQWVGQYVFDKNDNNFVMFGLGSGYFAKALLEKISDKSNIIIIEPEKTVFYKVLHEFDIADIIGDDRVHISVGNFNEIELYGVLSSFIYWANVSSLKLLVHPKYKELYSEYYEEVEKEVCNFVVQSVSDGATEEFFGKDISYNTVDNMKYMLDSHYVYEFYNVFPEESIGIVVAAGPSLDKNISVLKDIKGKGVIVATDTALRRLYDEGIVPDFVVSVDPRKPIHMFEEVGFEEIPFICEFNSNPKVLAMHTGKKIWANPTAFHLEVAKQVGVKMDILPSGGSVATTAFGLCTKLGMKNIVLIGQDLAYDGEVTHVGGEVDTSRSGEQPMYVEGNYVDKVKTRSDWMLFLEWYERNIRDLPEEYTVINATEGGAKIKGTKLMTLREVADEYCKNDIDVTAIINDILEKDIDSDIKDKTYEFLKKCSTDLKKMGKDIDKVITLCNRFERKYSKSRTLTPEVTKCMSDVNKATNRINEMPVYLLIDSILKHKDLNSIKEIFNNDDDEYTDNMNMMKNIKHIFELNRETLNEFSERFIKAVDEIGEQLVQDEC